MKKLKFIVFIELLFILTTLTSSWAEEHLGEHLNTSALYVFQIEGKDVYGIIRDFSQESKEATFYYCDPISNKMQNVHVFTKNLTVYPMNTQSLLIADNFSYNFKNKIISLEDKECEKLLLLLKRQRNSRESKITLDPKKLFSASSNCSEPEIGKNTCLDPIDQLLDKEDPIFQKNEHGQIYVRGLRKAILSIEDAKLSVLKAFNGASPDILTKLHGSQLLHGSTSASLLIFTKYNNYEGQLIPTGQLEAMKKVPFSGEIIFGREGINLEHLSTVFINHPEVGKKYARMNPSWTPEIGEKNLKETWELMSEENKKSYREKGNKEKSISMKAYENMEVIHQKRISEWKKLEMEERSLIENGFPVLYGIKPSRPDSLVIPQSDVRGEILIKDGTKDSEIKVIFVPKEKIEFVKKLLRKAKKDNISVEPLEEFDKVQGILKAGRR